MYALVYTHENDPEPRTLATARTLPAIQRQWRRLLGFDRRTRRLRRPTDHMRCIAILGPAGLVNYYGEPIEGGPRRVRCIMGVLDFYALGAVKEL